MVQCGPLIDVVDQSEVVIQTVARKYFNDTLGISSLLRLFALGLKYIDEYGV